MDQIKAKKPLQGRSHVPSKRFNINIRAAASKISTVAVRAANALSERKNPDNVWAFRVNIFFWRTILAWCTRKDIYKLKIIATAMVRKEGVIEALKAADKMEWVRLMNSICGRADGCADLRENFRLDAACN